MFASAALHAQALTPDASAVPPFYPADISGAYQFNQIQFHNPLNGQLIQGDGSGQTIAIVDAGDSPTVAQDLATFDAKFGLPPPPNFIKVNWAGQTLPLPPPVEDWALEIGLDVEWTHALAPKANIVLFEAALPTIGNADDLGTAVQSAANPATYAALGVPVAGVISNSYGSSEFSSEAALDYIYTTTDNHATFAVSTGDSAAPGEWPAFSPDVLAVGGTSLYTSLNSSGATVYDHETGWTSGGGGVSVYEQKPSFQNALSYTMRSIPDVSMDADPNTGVYVVLAGQGLQVGGTSLSAPLWSALLTDLNQGRALLGEGALGNAQVPIYGLPKKDFHDITVGNNGNAAGPGYDLVTGIGSPYANLVVKDLLHASSGVVTASTGGKGPHGQGINMSPLGATVPLATSSTPSPASPTTLSAQAEGNAAAVPSSVLLVAPGSAASAIPTIWFSTTAVVADADLLPAESLQMTNADQAPAPTPTAGSVQIVDDSGAQPAGIVSAAVSDDFFAQYGASTTGDEQVPAAPVVGSDFADVGLICVIGLLTGTGLNAGQGGASPGSGRRPFAAGDV
jgi:subtilase family serine protease